MRRKFLRQTAVTGAGPGIFDTSDVVSAQRTRPGVIPTPSAKALMGLFGLRYPIFQAPFGGIDLAAAISNAGAMGSIALWNSTPDAARDSVERLRSRTQRPFVVNYVLAFEPESLPAALDAGAPVVSFSWGLPARDVVSRLRKAGAKFGVQVGTVEGARSALDAAADYLICQGSEAGGHVQSSTPVYELLPKVLDEARQTPVLVAGGIGNGRTLLAALIAGAAGGVLGTRFVATIESVAHADYKDAIVRADARDAALSVCFQDGWPGATHRALRNGTLMRWEAAGCPPPGKRPGEGDVVATRPDGTRKIRYQYASPLRGYEGAVTDLAMYAGQSVGNVKDLPAASDLIERLWAECLSARRR